MKTRKIIFRLISILWLAFLPLTTTYGQGYVGSDPGKGSQMSAQPGGIVEEVSLSEPKTTGNHYLFESWFTGSIVTTDGKVIEGYSIRYDINNNGVEIKTDKQIKFISATRIDKFSLRTGLGKPIVYTNPRSIIKSNSEIPNVFLEIIVENEWTLYKQTRTKLVRGNYNAALDMGNRNSKIVKESQYIIGNGENYYIIVKSRRKMAKKISNRDEVFSFLKDNRLNLKDEEDLKKLTVFLSEQ